MSKLQLLAASMVNKPLLMEIGYAKSFIAELRQRLISGDNEKEMPDKEKQVADSSHYHPVTGQYRFYSITDGVAVISIRGTLAHKQGWYSWLMGYNIISYSLEQAVTDPDVQGIYLDMHTPGGTVMGAFDAADLIHRVSKIKPVWAISNDMNCSAGQLLASAASRRLVTQTGVVGSIGVVVGHTSYEKYFQDVGIEVTLLHSGSHKVEGNPYQALPKDVASRWQKEIDDTRNFFASKVSGYTGLSLQHVLDTEAAIYTGVEAVDIGLADELVHSADGISMLAEHVKNQNRTFTTGKTAMTDKTDAAAESVKTEPVAEKKEPVKVAVAEPASAEALVALCDQAGMPEQIGSMIKSGLTEDAAKGRLENLGKVRDTLAAANLGHMFADVSVKMDDPAAMLQVALTAATAHSDDKEVSATKKVEASEATLKQPDVKKAYKDPSRL